MRIEFPADPQQYIFYPLTRPRLRLERLPAVAALGGDVGLLHIYIVKVKVAINCNHWRPHGNARLRDPAQPESRPKSVVTDQDAK
jgi:hypothetical protein